MLITNETKPHKWINRSSLIEDYVRFETNKTDHNFIELLFIIILKRNSSRNFLIIKVGNVTAYIINPKDKYEH